MQPFQSQCIHPLTATRDSFLALHVHPISLDRAALNDRHHCTICWNQFEKTEFDDEKPEKPVRIDPCGHIFGQLCLEQHFRCNLQEAKCPTCRCDLYGISIEVRRQEIERRHSERAPQEVVERRSRPSIARYFSRSERRRRTTVTVPLRTEPTSSQPPRTESTSSQPPRIETVSSQQPRDEPADVLPPRNEPAGSPPPYRWTDDLNYRLTILLQSGATRPPDRQLWPRRVPEHNLVPIHASSTQNRRISSLGNGREMTDEEWMRRLMLFNNEIS